MRFASARALALAVAGLGGVACVPPPPKPAHLDAAKATAIQVGVAGGVPRFCAGGDGPQLDIAVTTSDGKRLDTWSAGEDRNNKLPWSTFEWTASWGQVDGDGYLRLPADAIAAIGRKVTVDVTVAGRPDVTGRVAITPDFGCGGTLGASGAMGDGGYSGSDGQEGRAGQSGDTSHGGGQGEDGGDAGDGNDGGPGGPGPRVEAALAFVDSVDGQRFAVLRTWVDGAVSTAIFDPGGAAWAVVAYGGHGGDGGRGGRGGSGGAGGAGTHAQSGSGYSSGSGSGSNDPGTPGTDGGAGGDGGQGGDGGRGGDGGDGGDVALVYDQRFPELADLVRLDNRGGDGGSAGWAGDGGYGGPGGDGERRGYDGRGGTAGRTGTAGRAGGPGRHPDLHPGDVSEVFSDLAARGLTLAKPH